MELLERDLQLTRLRRRLNEAADGRGHVVALIGEAGIGKTALAQAFAEEAAAGARVLQGACEDLSIPDPLAPLHDLARSIGWQLPQTLNRKGQRLALFSQALGSFDASDKANLLIVEDLHWADDATLDFIRFLGRRIRKTHILLLVTARNDQTEGQALTRRALADIPPDSIERLEVPPLSPSAVDALARCAGADATALYRATGGNAFYVTELVHAGGDRLPDSLRDSLLARADRLSDKARAVLDAASIFPRRAERNLLEQLCDEKLVGAIEECVDQGLLIIIDGGYTFRHEIARRAIEAALPDARRRNLNARALAILLGSAEVAIARLVHHAAAAGDGAAVRNFAPIAAKEASSVGAHREAARHYMTALTHANTFCVEERAALYEGCAFECHLVGRMVDAIRARRAALELHQAMGDRLKEGDDLRWLSRLSYLAGKRNEADDYARRAVDALDGAPPGPELAMAYSNLSQLAMLSYDTENSLLYGEKAIAIAEQQERPDILCHALNNVGTAEQWTQPQRGRERLNRSLEIALSYDFQEHVARCYTNSGCFEVNQKCYQKALRYLDLGISYCIERDLDTWRDYMRGWSAEVRMTLGDWDRAAEEASSVVVNNHAASLVRYPAVLALARLRTRRGDPDSESLLAELARFHEDGMELQRFVPFASLMAERAWLGLADTSEALQRIDQAVAMAPQSSMIADALVWQYRLAPEREIPDRDLFPEPYRSFFAGDWQAAAQAWAELGARYEEALALSGGDAEAQRRALSLLDALGADAVGENLRDRMRTSGLRSRTRRPRATTRGNPAGLTKRQMDVLRLIDEGLTNAKIGERLFVSPKTVDHHVSAILEKLEAGSRGEAAAIARHSGLI